jgi:hypothetical protein
VKLKLTITIDDDICDEHLSFASTMLVESLSVVGAQVASIKLMALQGNTPEESTRLLHSLGITLGDCMVYARGHWMGAYSPKHRAFT